MRAGDGVKIFFEEKGGEGRRQRFEAAEARAQGRKTLRGDREGGELRACAFPSPSFFLLLQLLGDRARIANRDGGDRRRGEGGVTRVGEESLGFEPDVVRLGDPAGSRRAVRHFQ